MANDGRNDQILAGSLEDSMSAYGWLYPALRCSGFSARGSLCFPLLFCHTKGRSAATQELVNYVGFELSGEYRAWEHGSPEVRLTVNIAMACLVWLRLDSGKELAAINSAMIPSEISVIH